MALARVLQKIQPGHIFGELASLTPGYHRTQSVECVESGHVLALPYDEVRARHFENPEFGFYFLHLASSAAEASGDEFEGPAIAAGSKIGPSDPKAELRKLPAPL
jgi:hypothetical protein